VGWFNEELLRGQDYDYWLRLSRITQIQKLDAELVLYRIHGDNIAKKYPDQNYELMVVENNVDRSGLTGPDGSSVSTKRLKHHLSQLCFSFGYWHYQRGTYNIARDAFLKCLHYQPTHLKCWVFLAVTMVRRCLVFAGQ
jgi:hypothetical protein